jgi:hypothetical protein
MGRIGLEVLCQSCGIPFLICKKDYRGHRYCSTSCRQQGSKKRQQKAQRKYAKSKKGQISNARRQAKYRKRQNSNKANSNYLDLKKNKVTDQSLILNNADLNTSIQDAPHQNKGCCCICGCKIDNLVRINERNRMEEKRLGKLKSGRDP